MPERFSPLLPGTKRPEVHGHRGCRGLRPENTLPAFLHALALGVDILEMDVVISADGQVVVSHEPWLNPRICLGPAGRPLSQGSEHEFNLFKMPYAIIRACDCGQLQHPGFPEQIGMPTYKPLLKEVLAAIEAEAQRMERPLPGYSIEVKSTLEGDNVFHPTPSEFLPLVLAQLDNAQVIERSTLLCFDGRILQLSHRLRPALATCLLLEADQPWTTSIRELGFLPSTLGPDFNSVTAGAVRELRTDFPGMRLLPWTVNELLDMRRLIALGVDGLTTDYPDRLLMIRDHGDNSN